MKSNAFKIGKKRQDRLCKIAKSIHRSWSDLLQNYPCNKKIYNQISKDYYIALAENIEADFDYYAKI